MFQFSWVFGIWECRLRRGSLQYLRGVAAKTRTPGGGRCSLANFVLYTGLREFGLAKRSGLGSDRIVRKGDVVETVTEVFNTILEWARAGFSEVNAVLGLIIAFVAAFIMPVYGRILVFSLGAVIVHVVAEVMLPVVQGTGSFKLPPLLETYFWQDALVLFIGYLIIISVFFLLKTMFLKK